MPPQVDPPVIETDAAEIERPQGADVADAVIALRKYIESKCQCFEDREIVFAATISLMEAGYTNG